MSNQTHILLIETSGDICSTAIAKAGQILLAKASYEKNSHSKFLATMVQDLLIELGLKPTDLNAVALGDGPGSYTGLRIGASFAKAICYSQNIPLIAVSSLKTIANASYELDKEADIYVSMIDARRMDAYVGIFDNTLKTLSEDFCTLTPELLNDHIKKNVICAGSASHKFKESLHNHKNIQFLDVQLLAEHLTLDAFAKFNDSDFEDLAYYEPNYIKSVHITAKKRTNFN